MAIHGEPAEAGADPVGPRWRTVVSVPAPVPDVDPGEALRRAVRALTVGEDWRVQAWSWYDSWTKAVNDHIRRTYAAETRRVFAEAARRIAARQQAVDGDPDPGEAVPFHAVAREAAESFNPVRGPGFADPSRPALAGQEEFRHWWHVGASIVAEGNDRPTDFADTGTFFYDPPTRTERS